MSGQGCFGDFEQDVLLHLNSAYNLARWLTRNDSDAEDIVQEAYLRAFKFHQSFRGGDARPWLLTIVRNVYYTWSRQNTERLHVDLNEDLVIADPCFANPEEVFIQTSTGVMLRIALEMLPARSRELLILHEIEGVSYKQISTVVGVPPGTVMSGLSRARAHLRQSVSDLINAGPTVLASAVADPDV